METVLSTPELLTHIFNFLDFYTIKTGVRFVSKFWKQQSEYCKIWKNVQLELDDYKKVQQVSKKILNSFSSVYITDFNNRYNGIYRDRMRITPRKGNNDLYNLYKKLSTCSRLKNLYVDNIHHKHRDFSKLLSIIPHLNRLNLYKCHLSSYQLTSIYRKIRNLQLLILDDDHRDVPADLLALSLTKVKKVKLEYANLSTKQLTLIYEEISSSSNSILEYLKIGFSDHTKVETELLISAFLKLKQVDSDTCRFKFEQIITILIDRRLDSSHSLEYLSLFAFPLNIERIPWYVKDNGERERCGLKKRFQSCYCSVIICTWDIYFYGTGTRED